MTERWFEVLRETVVMIMPILLPGLLGLALLGMPGERSAKWVQGYVRASILLQVVLIGVVLGLTGSNASFLLFQLTSNLMIYFKIDAINRISTCVMTLILVCTGLYTTSDGKEKRQEKRFCGFYLIFCGMVTGLNFAGNLITFYFFWEWMSVASIPLVLHRQTREAYGKGLRYILASFCGSAMVLTGTFFLFRFANTLTFAVGGVLDQELKKGREGLLLLVCLLMLAGILVKAGVVPFISWVPGLFEKIPLSVDTLLAGACIQAGLLGAIRTIFTLFGVGFLKKGIFTALWQVFLLLTLFWALLSLSRKKGRRVGFGLVTITEAVLFLLGMTVYQAKVLKIVLVLGMLLPGGCLIPMIHQTYLRKGNWKERTGVLLSAGLLLTLELLIGFIYLQPASAVERLAMELLK